MRTPRLVNLPFSLDTSDTRALPTQIADSVRSLVATGILAPGDALPSSRALAVQLGTSRGTVVAAYEQLAAEGYVASRPGGGTYIESSLAAFAQGPALRAVSTSVSSTRSPPTADHASIDLRPGRPWRAEPGGPGWRRAWREAAGQRDLGPAPAAGDPLLRAEFADHLRRTRGVVRSHEQVLVTAGAREGLALVLLALGLPARVGVEDPGYPSLRRVPAALGCRVVGLAVDGAGLVTASLPARDVPEVVLVTPSHQHPLGGSLPVGRRQELLAWARAHGVWVVEDDYHSELRYTSDPLPALASLDDPSNGRVVTLGSLAAILGAGIGAGFLAVPTQLLPRLVAARESLGQPVSGVTQRALAQYLAAGGLRRRTDRARTLYRRRLAEVERTLGDHPGMRVLPVDGGLHVVVHTLRPEAEVVTRAEAEGVLVDGLASYWSGGSPGPQGVVLGLGAVDDAALRRGLDTLAAVCRVSRDLRPARRRSG